MSNGSEKFDRSSANGSNSVSPAPNFDLSVRNLLAEVIRRSGLSRDQIVDLMNQLSGTKVITLPLLNAFSSPTSKLRFPASLIPAFCEAVHDDSLLRMLMGPRLTKLLSFAERTLATERVRRETETIKEELLREDKAS